jgi:hypothetical protein
VLAGPARLADQGTRSPACIGVNLIRALADNIGLTSGLSHALVLPGLQERAQHRDGLERAEPRIRTSSRFTGGPELLGLAAGQVACSCHAQQCGTYHVYTTAPTGLSCAFPVLRLGLCDRRLFSDISQCGVSRQAVVETPPTSSWQPYITGRSERRAAPTALAIRATEIGALLGAPTQPAVTRRERTSMWRPAHTH